MIHNDIKQIVTEKCGMSTLVKYMNTKFGWNEDTVEKVDWEASERASKK